MVVLTGFRQQKRRQQPAAHCVGVSFLIPEGMLVAHDFGDLRSRGRHRQLDLVVSEHGLRARYVTLRTETTEIYRLFLSTTCFKRICQSCRLVF